MKMIPNGPTNSHPKRFWRAVVDLRGFVLTGRAVDVDAVMFSPGLRRDDGGPVRSDTDRPSVSCQLTVNPCSSAYATTASCRASAASEPVTDPSWMAAICFVSSE